MTQPITDLTCARGKCNLIPKVTGSKVEKQRWHCKTCRRDVDIDEIRAESAEREARAAAVKRARKKAPAPEPDDKTAGEKAFTDN